jgi:hypothetical protein
MPSIQPLTIPCQCQKQQYPLAIDSNNPKETVLELVCPFSHSGQCGFAHIRQQITIPNPARPQNIVYKNLSDQ